MEETPIKEKKSSSDKKSPNPFYLIYCFSKYECQGDPSKILSKLATKEDIDEIVKKYRLTLIRYYKKWVTVNSGKEYNDMIKSQVDIAILDDEKDSVEDLLAIS